MKASGKTCIQSEVSCLSCVVVECLLWYLFMLTCCCRYSCNTITSTSQRDSCPQIHQTPKCITEFETSAAMCNSAWAIKSVHASNRGSVKVKQLSQRPGLTALSSTATFTCRSGFSCVHGDEAERQREDSFPLSQASFHWHDHVSPSANVKCGEEIK